MVLSTDWQSSRLVRYHAAPKPAAPPPKPAAPNASVQGPSALLWPQLKSLIPRLLAYWGLQPGAPSGPLDAERLRRGQFTGCLFGSSTPNQHETPEGMAAKLGRPLDINHSFYRWDHPVPSAEDRADVAAGRTPFISFNAITRSGASVAWGEIASGRHDERLREVARGIRSLGKPVFFTFNHEPENDDARGTPAEYRAAWKRVSDIFAKEGATNAVKVYVTMGWRPELSEAYYPGDAVDWIGGDPYNWAFTASQPQAKWRTFEQAASPFYHWARTKGKPLMIAETGTVEDPSRPGRKAQWIREMGETLKRWPEVKALNYFNNDHNDGQGTNSWRITTPSAVAAFRALGQDPYFARH